MFKHKTRVYAFINTLFNYLIFLKIQKELGLENNILFLKTGREKSFQKFDVDLALEKYLKYYGLCLSHPSPLIKDWAEELLFKNEKDLPSSSPLCSVIALKSTVLPSILALVPVFILST